MLEFEPNADFIETDLTKYRYDEYVSNIVETTNGLRFEVVYSVQKLTKVYAVISLSRMVFVTVLMAMSVLFFQQASVNLVLNPIERMLEKVRLIARNPLAATHDDQVEMAGVMSMIHKKE